MSAVKQLLKGRSTQDLRRVLVGASLPLRALPLPLARPLGSRSLAEHEVHSVRETGTFHATHVDFGTTMADRPYDLEASVLSIGNSECSFRNYHAIDGDRQVLYQREYPFGNLPVALQRLERLDGPAYPSVAYLSNTWVSNYYHWLMLVLPMVRHYRAAGIEIEKLYVGQPLNSWQKSTFEYAGLSSDMVITEPCRAEVGHVAILTRHTGGVSPEQIRWARSLFVPNEPKPGSRRLFVGRGEVKTRRMIDEEVFAEALEREFGFEYILTTGMTFEEEIELFGQTEAIIAPYGAALTNMLFSPTTTKVLELTAYEHDFRLAHCYQEMAAAMGIQLGTMRGNPTPRRKDGAYTHIEMDLKSLLTEVERMLNMPSVD